MKVILSRKGFDSKSGGFASPILPNGSMVSLPIPALAGEDQRITFSDLCLSKTQSYADVLEKMKRKEVKITEGKMSTWKPINEVSLHLDPDLSPTTLERQPGWRGLFGPSSNWQPHLATKMVHPGDLFLFFGWFEQYMYEGRDDQLIIDLTDQKSYPNGRHLIFGYLQVGEILRLDREEQRSRIESWMEYHPHIGNKAKYIGSEEFPNNALYIARETVSFESTKKGFGTFAYDLDSAKHLTLTKQGCSRSKWNLPTFFRETRISCHPEPWRENYFQSTHRGQEFIIDHNPNVEKWAESLIQNFGTT